MKKNRERNVGRILGGCGVTEHGRKRLQARAIPQEAIACVMTYGVEQHSHGASRFFLDQSARRKLEAGLGRTVLNRLGHKLDIVVVVGEGDRLITAMYRHKRILH